MTDTEKNGLLFLILGLFFMTIYKIDPSISKTIPVWVFLLQTFFGAAMFMWGGNKKKNTP